jgi:hypothetical protein
MSLYLLTYMAVSSYSNESRIRFRLGEPSRASDLAKFYSKGDDPMILVSFRGLTRVPRKRGKVRPRGKQHVDVELRRTHEEESRDSHQDNEYHGMSLIFTCFTVRDVKSCLE